MQRSHQLNERVPLISIIVAVRNASMTLQRCIDSVLNQSYPDPEKELIIIDGGSVDNTVEIIRENDDAIAYWESKPDKGVYHAWNKALEHANGDWICFLGADDYFWDPNVLTRISAYLEGAYPTFRVVYGKVALVSKNGKTINLMGYHWQQAKRNFMQIMSIPHVGLMHHRKLFEIHGKFNEHYRIAGDYDLLLRELKTRDALFVPDIVVAGMQYGGLGSNPKNSVLILKEIAHSRKTNSVRGIAPLWHWNYFKANLANYLSIFISENNYRTARNLYRRLTGRQPV